AVEGLRGRWISDRGAVIAGVVASSLIFTVFHLPGSISAFGFRMILGLLLGAAYVWTNSLALPIGLHFMTNFALNNIYGLSNVAEGGARAAMLL
ncbi:CPBP family intramembrane metalloprotease, partial [Halorubrum sp. SS7]